MKIIRRKQIFKFQNSNSLFYELTVKTKSIALQTFFFSLLVS